MILKKIVEFAEAHASGMPSGYQTRFVHKVIRIRSDGSPPDVAPLSGSKSMNRDGEHRPEPQESPRRSVNISARLIADNAEYVLGKVAEGRDETKIAERHDAWKQALKAAASVIPDRELQTMLAWIEQGGADALRYDPRIEAGDELTFEVDGSYPTELPTVQAYWAGLGESDSVGQCLITGIEGPIADRMPAPIKGIPGGQMSGTALVSVNNAAGESYGLSAALNSPISLGPAEKLCNGLNMLVNEHSVVKDASGKERKRYKYALRVGPIVYIAWSQNEHVSDFWEILDRPTPEHVHQLIAQPIVGGKAPSVSEADFYVVSLSANAARIIVRDYHETTLANVNDHLGKWFRRLQLVSLEGERCKPVGVYQLAASLYRDANKEMPASVPSDLVAAALKGYALPAYLLGLAVKRNLAMQGPFSLTKSKVKILSTSRLALIKATLTPDSEDQSLMQLNTEQSNPAYHCGRMLAILEAIQRLAIPGLNATLVDRNYGAACASPASIFGNLLKDATSAHLPKLRKSRPGAYFALNERLQDVAVAVGPDFPKTLPLKDQGLFALGFYHQRAWDLSEARKNKELKELADTTIQEEEVTE